MKELNIGKTIVTKRREKGLTQEDLAAYIGVSKPRFPNGKPARATRILPYYPSSEPILISASMN